MTDFRPSTGIHHGGKRRERVDLRSETPCADASGLALAVEEKTVLQWRFFPVKLRETSAKGMSDVHTTDFITGSASE